MSEIGKVWNSRAQKERLKPKFLKKGTLVTVDAKTAPQSEMVDGKFGKREMWKVETVEYGMIHVSAIQMIHINEVFKGNYSEPVTVEL
jgi:hypothetical protein